MYAEAAVAAAATTAARRHLSLSLRLMLRFQWLRLPAALQRKVTQGKSAVLCPWPMLQTMTIEAALLPPMRDPWRRGAVWYAQIKLSATEGIEAPEQPGGEPLLQPSGLGARAVTDL